MKLNITIFSVFFILCTNCFALDIPDGFEVTKSKSILHKSSGILFPKKFQKYAISKIDVFDPNDPRSVSVEYSRESIHISFYVYPREISGKSGELEFMNVFSGAKENKAELAEHQNTCTTIKGKRNSLEVYIGAISWNENHHSFGNWLLLAAGKNNFYYIRTTYPFNEKNIIKSRSVSASMLLELIPEKSDCEVSKNSQLYKKIEQDNQTDSF